MQFWTDDDDGGVCYMLSRRVTRSSVYLVMTVFCRLATWIARVWVGSVNKPGGIWGWQTSAGVSRVRVGYRNECDMDTWRRNGGSGSWTQPVAVQTSSARSYWCNNTCNWAVECSRWLRQLDLSRGDGTWYIGIIHRDCHTVVENRLLSTGSDKFKPRPVRLAVNNCWCEADDTVQCRRCTRRWQKHGRSGAEDLW